MDGVIKRKKIQKDSACNDDVYDVFSSRHNTNDEYHIFELGRPFRSGDVYSDCFLGRGAQRDFDVRALLENKESDSILSQKKHISFDHVAIDAPIEFDDAETDVRELTCDDAQDDRVHFSFFDLPIFSHQSILHTKHVSIRFLLIGGIAIFFLGATLFAGTAFAVKKRVESAGDRAIISMKSAVMNLSEQDLSQLGDNITNVHEEFVYASEEMDKISAFATFLSRFIPGTSKLFSGNNIIEAGKYLTHAAQDFNDMLPEVIDEDHALVARDGEHVSFLALYRLLADHMSSAHYDIAQAQQHLNDVYIDDVPQDYQDSFIQMKELLPEINDSLRIATEARPAVEDILGANGPRTYLFLLQNNHEMRATGGFIGSYGIVRINNGRIEKMFVDDIFNPDGQLIDRVVPPLPLQKISADWSLHDSNWFPDFPVSAKKAIDFYERTGGPTVDGVIAITPTMMEKFLAVTGPLDMPAYDVVITQDNFMKLVQDEVEDRDNYVVDNAESDENSLDNVLDVSTENDEQNKKPKAILSDLMPIMIDELTRRDDPKKIVQVLEAISEGIKERHIIMYTSNVDMQEIIHNSGWSGEILQTDKDYLSVVNTNINGFKTDGVVDEVITHTANIDEDGYIVNTVRIERHHTGGHTGYPWWDTVNANYMRVYVPQGSQFISVDGQTRELNEQRLDYDALGYERDQDVVQEESHMQIDEESGTRIYDEYDKTVFANWVYVSPQETATITYTYRLPYRTDFHNDDAGTFGSYAILFQKQSGSEHTVVKSTIVLDSHLLSQWHSHGDDSLVMENDLMIDRYHGVVFRADD